MLQAMTNSSHEARKLLEQLRWLACMWHRWQLWQHISQHNQHSMHASFCIQWWKPLSYLRNP